MSRHLIPRIAIFSLIILSLILPPDLASARNPYKNAFFNVYPAADGSRLDVLPSTGNHCGVCHFDFDGGGTRNPYGLAFQVALNSGNYGSTAEAILSLEEDDSDADSFTNIVEITDTVNFDNTPTFPGLTAVNVASTLNVDQAELIGYLTPAGGSDTDPPEVTVLTPGGGESYAPNTYQTLTWTADDPSGVTSIDVFHSDDGGVHFKPLARGLPDTGSFDWFVSNRPGTDNLLRVRARDGAGNYGYGLSGGFTIEPFVGGVAPTTIRDFDLPGTQPFEGAILDDPNDCRGCHGDYDHGVEPWHAWRGSMMGQAMRDPHYLATVVIAEQDAPASGDLCIRCHTPGGWQEGRSQDTSMGMINAKDREGVQCDFCHRSVDPHYEEGVSPLEDLAILLALEEIPPTTANGMFVSDPAPVRRGPYADALAAHQFLESPFHRDGDFCGTCHDVSNPVFVQGANPAEYVVQELDAPHPDFDLRNMFPVERTFSEWTQSEYAETGVYAPQFAGAKPDGIVSTCQDCHMRDVVGIGAVDGPVRNDLPLHDLTGGNHYVGDILPTFFPDEVDLAQLQDAKARAIAMLQLAATLELEETTVGEEPALLVRVTNETGHKLPSGYPEGRRIWLNVKAYDDSEILLYESCAYDAETAILTHDEDAKVYEIKPGASTRLADALGIEAGVSFHFVLNDSVYADNRIPPRGFTNAAFEAVQSPPVAYSYADGQYWDETVYVLPPGTDHVVVALYYQSTSKEYVDFLRDANTTNDLGQRLHDAWSANGKAAPVQMASGDLILGGTAADDQAPQFWALRQNMPNPFNPTTTISYSLAASGQVRLTVHDSRGRLVRTLVDGLQGSGEQAATWNGRDERGNSLASGLYFYRLRAGTFEEQRKMLLLK